MAIRVRSAALVAVLVCGCAIAAISGGGGTGASPSPAAPAVPPPGLLPGRELHGAELSKKLSAALAALGPKYVPRTEHRLGDGRPRFTNRLILEDSPYLRQHAHNPVMIPVLELTEDSGDLLEQALSANYDRALDARYAHARREHRRQLLERGADLPGRAARKVIALVSQRRVGR